MIEVLIDRLENHYQFECDGGPLKNCVEWQKLKSAITSQQADDAKVKWGMTFEQKLENHEYAKASAIVWRDHALRLQASANEWRDIASAPKDGRKIDLLFEYPRGRQNDCQWREGGVYGDGDWYWSKPIWGSQPGLGIGYHLLPESEWETCHYPNMQPTHWRWPPPAPEGEGGHVLYKTGDADAPDQIRDRNGEVVLGLCRKCGKAEAELKEPCITEAKFLRSALEWMRDRDDKNGSLPQAYRDKIDKTISRSAPEGEGGAVPFLCPRCGAKGECRDGYTEIRGAPSSDGSTEGRAAIPSRSADNDGPQTSDGRAVNGAGIKAGPSEAPSPAGTATAGVGRCLPPDPTKDGYHWIKRWKSLENPIPLYWDATWHKNAGRGWGHWEQIDREDQWQYIAPCPFPTTPVTQPGPEVVEDFGYTEYNVEPDGRRYMVRGLAPHYTGQGDILARGIERKEIADAIVAALSRAGRPE